MLNAFLNIAMRQTSNLHGWSNQNFLTCRCGVHNVQGMYQRKRGMYQRKRGIFQTSASRSANFGSKKDLVKGRECVHASVHDSKVQASRFATWIYCARPRVSMFGLGFVTG